MQSPFMHWIDVEQLGDFTKKLFMFLPASICMSTLKDSHSLISQFHIRLYKDHNLLIPFFTTKCSRLLFGLNWLPFFMSWRPTCSVNNATHLSFVQTGIDLNV